MASLGISDLSESSNDDGGSNKPDGINAPYPIDKRDSSPCRFELVGDKNVAKNPEWDASVASDINTSAVIAEGSAGTPPVTHAGFTCKVSIMLLLIVSYVMV